MAITTPLMDEILQHFARVFPMPGRVEGREDYLALVKTWVDQLEPYSDEQVKEACRRVMGKLKRFPYPSDVHEELTVSAAEPFVVGALRVHVDISDVDAALLKVQQLHSTTEILNVGRPLVTNDLLTRVVAEAQRTNALIESFVATQQMASLTTTRS